MLMAKETINLGDVWAIVKFDYDGKWVFEHRRCPNVPNTSAHSG